MVKEAEDIEYLRGKTNTAAALDYVVDTMFDSRNGDRSSVANLLVMLTDGNSNDKDATVTAAMR